MNKIFLANLLLFVLIMLQLQCAAQARLGESYITFLNKVARNFKVNGHKEKDNKSYYTFTMILDKNTLQADPGFGGGLTLTVINGKIVGQSMLLRLGENPVMGRMLSAMHTLDFAYESLGRVEPKSKAQVETELKSYQSALSQVLSGIPQNITYPGIAGKITISKTLDGDIVLAATP